MKKKFIVAAFLFCAVQILAVSQNFDKISQIIETKKITVAQASYLVANYLGVVEEDEEIAELIEKRSQARKNKDFRLADEIRDTLKDKGIILEDTQDGVKWKRS